MIETARLRLRPLEARDAPFMLALLNDADFIANIADRGVRDEAAAARYIADGPTAQRAAHGYAMDAVEERVSGRTVGLAGLVRRPVLDAPDLGYAFLPEARGKSYASEAGFAVLADAKARGLGRVLALVKPGNRASIRVLERLGFVAEGQRMLPGADHPSCLFAIAL